MDASGLDEVTSRLTDGLTACRTILSDYRALIGGKSNADRARPEEPADGLQGD